MIINEAAGAVDTGFTGSQQPIIQNLGPGDIHFSTTNQNVLTNGLYLPAGGVYEFPATLVEGGNKVFVQVYTGHGSADVRLINVG
jgi:hypothetical protein